MTLESPIPKDKWPTPVCLTCRKRIERWSYRHNAENRTHDHQMWCHGEKAVVMISERNLAVNFQLVCEKLKVFPMPTPPWKGGEFKRCFCLKCDKLVDEQQVDYDTAESHYVFAVACHGAFQVLRIDMNMFQKAWPDVWRLMTVFGTGEETRREVVRTKARPSRNRGRAFLKRESQEELRPIITMPTEPAEDFRRLGVYEAARRETIPAEEVEPPSPKKPKKKTAAPEPPSTERTRLITFDND